MIIAIDGPAGSGKSVVSRLVAERLGFRHLNSGKLYRGITHKVLELGVQIHNEAEVIAVAESLQMLAAPGGLTISGSLVPDSELHGPEVDACVSAVSAVPTVRQIVNKMLRTAAADANIVIEGRDITTVVFPDADLKVYLDADIESRAQRRFAQQAELAPETRLSLAEIRVAIAARDQADTAKEHGALQLAPDALYLDTSHLTIDEVCDKVSSTIQGDKIQQEN